VNRKQVRLQWLKPVFRSRINGILAVRRRWTSSRALAARRGVYGGGVRDQSPLVRRYQFKAFSVRATLLHYRLLVLVVHANKIDLLEL
jgi:hypothetical protein